MGAVTGHDLRARTLISREDPRIARALAAIPHDQRPASPDAAYYQAALIVAERDARAEIARRHSPIGYRIGRGAAVLLIIVAAAGIIYAILTLALWVVS